MRLVASTTDARSIVTAGDRWYDKSIVASCDRSYEQSWHQKTDDTINRGVQRSIARLIVASCDRSYDQSLRTRRRSLILKLIVFDEIDVAVDKLM